jgi:hypothetical protein
MCNLYSLMSAVRAQPDRTRGTTLHIPAKP